MIRVLHVLEAIEGGTARHLADLVTHARDVEHVVAVPAVRSHGLTDHRAVEQIRAGAIAVEHLPLRRSVTSPANVVAVARLRSLVARTRPDVLHGHSSIGGVAARAVARWTGVPAVYTPNGIQTGRAALAVERGLARWTSRLVAVSPTEADTATRHGLAPPGRVRVVANGIDLAPPPRRDLRPLVGLPPGTPLVGTVARLIDQKSPHVFVDVAGRVAARVPTAHVVLIGAGPLADDVDAAVRADGRLTGRFHRLAELPDAGSFVGSLDVFCLLSRFEGAPYTPLEAMRAGAPVVLSDVVGNHDVIGDDDGRAGFLVPLADPALAAGVVVELLEDPARRAAVVAAAATRLREHFDVRRMAAATTLVYEEAVAEARSASASA